MDGNQTAINAAGAGANVLSTAVQGQESGTDGASGFARLFSMLQSKASELVHAHEKQTVADASGEKAPEGGNILPLQFDYKINKGNVPKPDGETAVLSASATRTASSLAAEAGVVGLTGSGSPAKTAVSDLQAEAQVKPTTLSAQNGVPEIHLPEVDGDASATQPSVLAPVSGRQDQNEVLDIAAVGKIAFGNSKQDIPEQVTQQAVASTNSVAATESLKAAVSPEAGQISRILGSADPAVTPDKVSSATFPREQMPANNRVVTDEVRSQAVVTETGFTAGEGLGGIDALRRELGDGHYAAEKIADAAKVAAQSRSTASAPVEMAGLETRSIERKPSADSLVEAAFLRPASEASGKVASAQPPSQTFAVAKAVHGQINTPAPAVHQQAFELMWKQAHPVGEIMNDKAMEAVPGARPVSDLSASSLSSIALVDASLSASSTRPSLATQPMMSAGQPAGLPTPTLNIRQSGWEHGLASNVSWMAHHNLKDIQVRVSPAELGPIHLHATMDKDQLNLQIVAHHGMTREALEAAAPRLRDLLGSEQFSSVNVDVSNGGTSGQQGFTDHSASTDTLHDDKGLPPFIEPQAAASTVSPSGTQVGLIDTFA